MSDNEQALVLSQAAYTLRALGRLNRGPRADAGWAGELWKQEHWQAAAITASNLSELKLTLGEVAGAVKDAQQSVSHADRSGDAFQRGSKRETLADALHQAGRRAESEARFREAEKIQAERQPDYPLLYSTGGFRYCDLLLTEAARVAWRVIGSGGPRPPGVGDAHRATLQGVSERAAQTLKWAELNSVDILSAALDYLTLGCAALYAAILEGASFNLCPSFFGGGNVTYW